MDRFSNSSNVRLRTNTPGYKKIFDKAIEQEIYLKNEKQLALTKEALEAEKYIEVPRKDQDMPQKVVRLDKKNK